jgi:hypothetical protein
MDYGPKVTRECRDHCCGLPPTHVILSSCLVTKNVPVPAQLMWSCDKHLDGHSQNVVFIHPLFSASSKRSPPPPPFSPLWLLRGQLLELCSAINESLRDHNPFKMPSLAILARCINHLCLVRARAIYF